MKLQTDEEEDELGEYGLSPELTELAQILASQPGNKRFQWDWTFIEKHASQKLKALIRSKTHYSSFRTNPMRIVVGDVMRPLFVAYLEELRKDDDVMEEESVDDEGTEKPPVEEKPCRRAAFSDVLYGDIEKDVIDEESVDDEVTENPPVHQEKPRRRTPSAKVLYNEIEKDAENDRGLPPELVELVHIVESQPAKGGKTAPWDWNYIERKASGKLRHFIAIKKQQGGIINRKSVAGEHMAAFGALQKRRRRKIRARDAVDVTQDSCETVADSAPKKKKRRRKKRRVRDDFDVTQEESKRKQARRTSNSETATAHGETVAAPAPKKKQAHPTQKQLTTELEELAILLANSKRRSWAYIESKASPRLRSYIREKAQEDPTYVSAPLHSLVPDDCLEAFNNLVEGTVETSEESTDEDLEVNANKENRKLGNVRSLGRVFALERKSRIKALTSNLRAELRAFEAQEVNLWDSFLQG